MSDGTFTFEIPTIAALAGARALVTGGAGFIGTRLCDLLRASGWIVHSASRREVGTASAHQHWQVDLTNAEATKLLVTSVRPDYVFHLASHVYGALRLIFFQPSTVICRRR